MSDVVGGGLAEFVLLVEGVGGARTGREKLHCELLASTVTTTN